MGICAGESADLHCPLSGQQLFRSASAKAQDLLGHFLRQHTDDESFCTFTIHF